MARGQIMLPSLAALAGVSPGKEFGDRIPIFRTKVFDHHAKPHVFRWTELVPVYSRRGGTNACHSRRKLCDSFKFSKVLSIFHNRGNLKNVGGNGMRISPWHVGGW
jgi:hypothetical protein